MPLHGGDFDALEDDDFQRRSRAKLSHLPSILSA